MIDDSEPDHATALRLLREVEAERDALWTDFVEMKADRDLAKSKLEKGILGRALAAEDKWRKRAESTLRELHKTQEAGLALLEANEALRAEISDLESDRDYYQALYYATDGADDE